MKVDHWLFNSRRMLNVCGGKDFLQVQLGGKKKLTKNEGEKGMCWYFLHLHISHMYIPNNYIFI